MPQWTEEKPLRVATGFTYVCGSRSTNVSNFNLRGTVSTVSLLKESLIRILFILFSWVLNL